MSFTVALIGLATALVPLAIFFVQRRAKPDPEQRRDDIARDFALLEGQIAEAEARGDFATADALRQLMRDRIAPEHRADINGPVGERIPPPPPSGDSANRSG